MTTTQNRQLAEERVGTRLDGKWHLDALLGYGGSAAVYAATHRNGNRAAIKILHPHCMADEQLRQRFVREGYLANKIGHPGAVSILDDNVAEEGAVYLVMELLIGTSLERLGKDNVPRMNLDEVLVVADDLLDVLAHAHAVGVVHRDIKPANIFLTTEGQLKVLDFGIARLREPAMEGNTQTGLMMGTPAFMSPEQARARWDDVDQRSDIWAAGATLLALLIGRRPRIADTANEELLLAMTEPLPPTHTVVPGISPEIGRVIDKAVAFRREDRWGNAREMQEALRAAAGFHQSSATLALVRNGDSGGAAFNPFSSTTSTLVRPPVSAPPSERLAPKTEQLGGAPIRRSHGPLPVPEHEPASLTTSRAVLQSAHPEPLASTPSTARAAIALSAILTVGCVGAALLYIVARHPATAHTTGATGPTTASTLDPPSIGSGTPVAVTTDPSPSESPTASTSPTVAAHPLVAATVVKSDPRPDVKRDPPRPTPPKPQPQPQPSTAANPAKYFDTRF